MAKKRVKSGTPDDLVPVDANVIDQRTGPGWAAYQGDSVEVVRGIPDRSVDHIIYSPPFASLYTYSASDRDMGNCRTHSEFHEHYGFLLGQLLRIIKPGRIMGVHCMVLPTSKARDGHVGLTDFPGVIIAAAERAGWIYHADVVIWKDPVTAMQRTKALGLLHKQLKKDSCMSRMGIPDRLLFFRAPGENAEPVEHTAETFPVEQWQRYASPVWALTGDNDADGFAICSQDIDPNDTLQYQSAREHDDERHICLAEGSLVLTREFGYQPIEMVEPGNHVLTHLGRWKPVIEKRCNGAAETVKLSAQGVANLVLTPDHKVLVKPVSGSRTKESAVFADPEWRNAADTVGSYVNMPLPPVEDNALTDEEWWIIGRWLGDGHRGTRRTSGARGAGFGEFIISCAFDEVDELVAKLGVHAGQRVNRTAAQITLAGLRHEVRETLNRCGKGAANKRLPGEAVTLCREKAEALLSGYLSADGHYVEKYDRVCASSISRALLLGMSIIAMRARGAVASVYAGRGDREGTICGRDVHMRQDWVFAFRNSKGYKMSGWIDEGGSWRKVRSVVPAGERQVWDLQVEDDESFAAEGCIVHNCPLQLEVIRRSLRMYSNPGDIVFSPFMGIGSEGWVSLKAGRRFVGIELKQSYYRQAVANLGNAVSQLSLFPEAS